MIKNKYKLILILLIMLLIPSNKVKADDNSLIYDISYFNINENANTMELKGFAFIDHINNNGYNGNLKRYIVAYTGGWKSEYENCGGNNSCKKIEIFGKESNYDTNRNYYLTRCSSEACKKYDSVVKNPKSNCNDTNKHTDGSQCIYDNVEFDVKINLKEIIDKLGDKEIHFRIVGQVGTIRRSDDISINQVVYGKEKEVKLKEPIIIGEPKIEEKYDGITKKIVTTTKYIESFTVDGINNDRVTITASRASVKEFKDNIYSNVGYGKYLTKQDYMLNTNILKKGRSTNEVVLTKPGTGIKYKSKVYAVYANSKNYKSCNPNSKNCTTFYTTVDWAKPEGKLKIKQNIKTKIEEEPSGDNPDPTCPCFGGACNKNSCVDKSEKTKTCTTINKKEDNCISKNYSRSECTETNKSSVYYYKVEKNQIIEAILNAKIGKTSLLKMSETSKVDNVQIRASNNIIFANEKGIKKEGYVKYDDLKDGNYTMYIPVKFMTNYKVYQENTSLKLNYTDKQTIKSGRFFEYSLNYKTTAGYKNLAENNIWSVNNWYTGNISKKRIKIEMIYVYGVVNHHVNNAIVYLDLKADDKIYKYDKNGITSLGNASNMYRMTLKDVDVFNKNLELKTVFDNSNDYYNDNKKSNAGKFTCNIVPTNTEKTEVKADCNYVINKAYLNKITGNVVYPKEPDTETYRMATENKGSIYFIPYNMPTGKEFFFTIQSDNLSLINSMNYKYNAKCKVIAKNEIKDGPESKVTYRPIKNNDPFPSNKYTVPDTLSANWKEFFDKTKTLNRLNNLYQKQYISYQTNILTKDLIKKIKNYSDDNVYGDYNERGDINSNGKDKILTDNNNIFSITRGKHCEAGKFDDTCDKTQGSR